MLSDAEIWKVPSTVVRVTACLERCEAGEKTMKERIDRVHIRFASKVKDVGVI